MRKISCDWCDEDIDITNYDPTHIEFYTAKMIDLCESCHSNYFRIKDELAAYNNELNEKNEELLKAKYKELLKKEVINSEEE